MREFERQIKRVVNKANYWKERDIEILCNYTSIKEKMTKTTKTKSIVMGLDYVEILGDSSNIIFDGMYLYFDDIEGIKAYSDKYILKLNNGDIIKIAARM